MTKEHHAIYEILRDFAVSHLGDRGAFEQYESTAEIEKVLQRIDQARGIREEPDEAPGQEASGADYVGNFQQWLSENADLFAPFVTSTLLVRHVRAAKGALKRSAYADVVRTIIECERFMEEIPKEADKHLCGSPGDQKKLQIITYLETLRGVERRLSADLDASRTAVKDN